MMAQHKIRVRRAKRKLYATWWGLGFAFYSALVVLYMTEVYWLMPLTFTTAIYLMIRANTHGANQVYQAGVGVGLSLGSLAAVDAYKHAMFHAAEGTEPCETATKLRVTIPHLWEDEFVREEIHGRHADWDDDDDDDDDDEQDRMFNDPPRS